MKSKTMTNSAPVENMGLRLAEMVQVRKESWGLLFYSQTQHRMFFVRSGKLLTPARFDGRWTFETLVADVARKQPDQAKNLNATLKKLIDNLVKNGMVINELH
jgi:putative mycofactocin binding protein MftB